MAKVKAIKEPKIKDPKVKKEKKVKKLKLKNKAANGSAKNKTYTFIDTESGQLVPRDCTYPFDAPGFHEQGDF